MRDSKRVTLKDIAKVTGYSSNTVSKALRDAADLSTATKDVIRQTAGNMGYVANAMASGLRSGHSNVIALIISDISNPFFGILTKEVEAQAMQYGSTVIVLNTEEDEKREEQALKAAISRNVDGVLLVPAWHGRQNIRMLQNAKKPCVLVGRHLDDVAIDSVCFTDERGGYDAVSYLLSRDYRNVLMINVPYNSSASERERGYRKALTEYSLPSNVITVSSALGGVRDELSRVIQSGAKFDAVFAFSDLIAFEAVCVLAEYGIKVPEDVGIVGFDDIQSRFQIPFPLNTVTVPKRELGVRIVDLLMRRISGDTEGFPQRVILETKLTVRGSAK
ncbi:MAG: LacI family transcriptional regulator [Clostridiales bacterium]|jgi:LacI family transcriptional regulator|nr:LacI family transcriptional regulator [Clostridiales bacterium]